MSQKGISVDAQTWTCLHRTIAERLGSKEILEEKPSGSLKSASLAASTTILASTNASIHQARRGYRG